MKRIFLIPVLALLALFSYAQTDGQLQTAAVPEKLILERSVPATPVKNQAATNTCWSFSTTSLIESQCLKKGLDQVDISEMFSVRNIYIEKAKNYILRLGHAQFGEGGLGHDLIRAIATYGAVPENVYSGLKTGQRSHNHTKLISELKQYLDSILKLRPLPQNWLEVYIEKLDIALGKPPEEFTYQGKKYTPKSFASEVLKFDEDEYVNITSFTHHPFYAPFIIEVPDNFSNGAYYNIPLSEMMEITRVAIRSGYSVMWDADISNAGFMQNLGVAVHTDSSAIPLRKMDLRRFKEESARQKKNSAPAADAEISQLKTNKPGMDSLKQSGKPATVNTEEAKWDSEIRQILFENLTTQDDHLMHITGIEKTGDGKTYFLVKNSWGEIGPKKGYISVSEAYFAINTISLILPKASLPKALLEKMKIK